MPNAMLEWIDVGPVSDFPEGEHVCTAAGGREIVVFHVEQTFYVISNICPHAGMPLGEGDCRGHVITCPFHGYAYNIKNGRNIDWPEDEPPVRTYPVRIENDVLQIEMEPRT